MCGYTLSFIQHIIYIVIIANKFVLNTFFVHIRNIQKSQSILKTANEKYVEKTLSKRIFHLKYL